MNRLQTRQGIQKAATTGACLLACLLLTKDSKAGDEPRGEQGESTKRSEGGNEDADLLYLYLDDKGQLHIVDRLELIPSRYRSGAWQAEGGRPSGAVGNRTSKRQSTSRNLQTNEKGEGNNRSKVSSDPPKKAKEASESLGQNRSQPGSESLKEPKRLRDNHSESKDGSSASLQRLRKERQQLLEAYGGLELGYDEEDRSAESLEKQGLTIEQRLRWLEAEISRLEKRR